MKSTPGVTVAICCHNSASRLPQTLSHLAAQSATTKARWEALVIDNASSDETSKIARLYWPQSAAAPLRVVAEPRLGLANARVRAFREAAFELVSFIDDDNWVCADWVQLISDLMATHPEIGACGGFSEAACEIDPPPWFARCKDAYAISSCEWEMGDITKTKRVPFGAGLTIRKAAWEQITSNGFRFRSLGRKGHSLGGGEDLELCLAIRAAGWHLWREPSLRFLHFMPASRLQWRYCRKLHRGCAMSTAGLDRRFGIWTKPRNLMGRLRSTLPAEVLYRVKLLLSRPAKLGMALVDDMEGDMEVLQLESEIGALIGCVKSRVRWS